MSPKLEAMFRFFEHAGELIAVMLFGAMMYFVLAG